MRRPPRTAPQRTGDGDVVLRAVDAEARRLAGTWFPSLQGRPVRTWLVRRQQRPRCFLYHVRVGDGTATGDVVVKVRHAVPELRKLDRGEGRRPVLTPERALPDGEAARWEYAGLKALAGVFDGRDPARFGVLRPLAWLPDHGAIVMDHVAEPTLQRVLATQSGVPGRHVLTAAETAPWSNAGAWLRTFHDALPGATLPERGVTSHLVGDLHAAYAPVIGRHRGDDALLAHLGRAAQGVGGGSLTDVPLATGHGDYTMRNVFCSPSGRVTVFDPLPVWRVPVYEDVARFLVGLRTTGRGPLAHVAAHHPERLDACEAAFVDGYFGRDPAPRRQLLAFQAVFLLDRWAGTVGKLDRRGGVHQRLRAARVAVVSGWYRAEARRLLALLS